MTQIEIAKAFSGGQFESCYAYLTDASEWNVIGEHHWVGKQSIIDFCEKTAKYFDSVSTNFQEHNLIANNNRVAINGTGEFVRDGARVAFVSSCDVYVFDNDNKIISITSYCIPDKNK